MLRPVKEWTPRELQKAAAFMRCAHEIAQLSTCRRKPRGAVLVTPDWGQVLAVGYNGPARGLPNDSCTGGEGTCGCAHAEVNCLLKPRPPVDGLLLLCTGQPCVACAQAVLNSRTVGAVLYRDESGLGAAGEELLLLSGLVDVNRLWLKEDPRDGQEDDGRRPGGDAQAQDDDAAARRATGGPQVPAAGRPAAGA
jgi:deoxycytidylate deaminase